MTHHSDNVSALISDLQVGVLSPLVTRHWRVPPRQAVHNVFPSYLHPALADFFQSRGITGLYSHQLESIASLERGRNVIISTGTSSGKTLCYNLPVINKILKFPESCALYLFPTKALTEDQAEKLREINDHFRQIGGQVNQNNIQFGIYDGDTSAQKRTAIRNNAHILLSNPDMLHLGILPHHTNWVRFFSNIKYVVLDEAHTYRGVFGSHVANLFRRLKRILSFYNAQPQYILSSATISNPRDLAEKLLEEEFDCIANDGSPQPERTYFFLNPPVINPDLGLRKGLIEQSLEAIHQARQHRIQTIAFTRSRQAVEITLKRLKENLPADAHQEVSAYRSGFLPRQRREIESGLRDGRIHTVITTNALELGIDMGGVDLVILMGYPGTIASFRQQSGRAGRREHAAIALFIASSNPIDQYIIRHPEFIQGKSPEKALLDANNALILLDHLRCALFELPFKSNDCFGSLDWEKIEPYMQVLNHLTKAIHSQNDYIWRGEQYPSAEMSLRNVGGTSIQLRVEQENASILLGSVDYPSAFRVVHPHAVYLQNGEAFRVKSLDLEHSVAILESFNDSVITEPKSRLRLEIDEIFQQFTNASYCREFAQVTIIEQVTGFDEVDWSTRAVISHHELDLPAHNLQTTALVLKLKPELIARLRAHELWKNDSNQYGADWAVTRKRILARDHYQCQVCGKDGDAPLFHVHHKIPFRTYIDPQKANESENLITLCPLCHRQAEQNVRMRSGLSGLAYLFSQIATINLMCDSHDLGYLIEPESKHNQQNPLFVIFDQIPGGIGLSSALFADVEYVLQSCLEVVVTCPCLDGCPACVGPAGENGVGGKEPAAQLIREMLSPNE